MRHRTPSRGIAALLSLALVLGLGAVATVASGVVTAAPAQAATGTLSLGHGATPASVLAGEDATIALRAEHTGAAADIAYNLTFVATLPPGATYVAGSATPASGPGAPGEPTAQQVVPNPADPSSSYWVLVWSNVTDLPAGGVASLGFDLDLDEARFPAGSTVVVPSRVLGSADERIVPKVTVATSGVTHVADASASDTAQTRVSPLEITKSEPSSESERCAASRTSRRSTRSRCASRRRAPSVTSWCATCCPPRCTSWAASPSARRVGAPRSRARACSPTRPARTPWWGGRSRAWPPGARRPSGTAPPRATPS
ncbi:hypothetical protein ACFP82_17630 [Cellulomonas gelida]|uniref:hypothetical protein n=1 Tax=Cellulomonas gelida TaxID=1712 RepID=UPI0036226953